MFLGGKESSGRLELIMIINIKIEFILSQQKRINIKILLAGVNASFGQRNEDASVISRSVLRFLLRRGT